jgi:hypothetical protein
MARASTKAVAWAVYRFAAKPKYIGRVEARDEKEALEKAFAEFKIPQHERFKFTVRRD